jgi:hypothetical protein
MVELPADVFDPEFARQFSRFTTAFNVFSHQIGNVYGGIHHGNNYRSHLTTSPLYMDGRVLTTEWMDFIGRANSIDSSGLGLFIRQIERCFAILFHGLGQACQHIARTKLRTELSNILLVRVKSSCQRLREMVSAAIYTTKSQLFQHLDWANFDLVIRYIVKEGGELFERFMPRFRYEDAVTGMAMITSCADIGALVRAASEFEGKIVALKRSMLRLNEELTAVYERLDLPFAVQLGVDEGRCPSLNGEVGKEEEEKENK